MPVILYAILTAVIRQSGLHYRPEYSGQVVGMVRSSFR